MEQNVGARGQRAVALAPDCGAGAVKRSPYERTTAKMAAAPPIIAAYPRLDEIFGMTGVVL